MNIQCPKCGGDKSIPELRRVSIRQQILAVITLGVYDPWAAAVKASLRDFFDGSTTAICEICGYTFGVKESIDQEQVTLNQEIRRQGEKRLAREKELEEQKWKNYPAQ